MGQTGTIFFRVLRQVSRGPFCYKAPPLPRISEVLGTEELPQGLW